MKVMKQISFSLSSQATTSEQAKQRNEYFAVFNLTLETKARMQRTKVYEKYLWVLESRERLKYVLS